MVKNKDRLFKSIMWNKASAWRIQKEEDEGLTYITHKRSEGEYQLLRDHIQGVADRAEMFAAAFEAGAHGRRAGLLHDIGKYSDAAQARQRDPEHTAKVDHSTLGAKVAMALHDPHAAFCVAGHHGGLPNKGSQASREDGTLLARIKKDTLPPADAWRTEIDVQEGDASPAWLHGVPARTQGFAHALYTRMLFSCLVDADYLDTEDYMSYAGVSRGSGATLTQLLARLEQYVAPWRQGAASVLNKKRSEILERCLRGAGDAPGLYTLTVPTGGGKTVSSLAFALAHGAAHGLRRVIYVVPYTSIIEQNAAVFRQVVGAEHVLEHHANAEHDAEEERLRLATENWDAPIVVTTAVQFFESLFSARASRCRKLHNIASSVVIFDEAQMLPMPFLRPCVDAIAELAMHYHVTAVLCTATQLSLGKLFADYAPRLPCRELAENVEANNMLFRRTTLEMTGEVEESTLAEQLANEAQVLCIVNTRKRTQALYALLPEEGRFHLSTLMTPEHRTAVLEDIRKRLHTGQICRVVSTSLVEAGVDLDFPTVWREESGLDSILQAAGRCNREGRHPVGESIVHVFRFGEKPPKMFEQHLAALQITCRQHQDMASPQAIRTYFTALMFLRGDAFLDQKNIVEMSARLLFQDIDESFRLIDSRTVPVYIPTEENRQELAALRSGCATRGDLRRLGRWAVNVYSQHFESLRMAGALECPAGDQYGILLDDRQYDPHCGLTMEPDCGLLFA